MEALFRARGSGVSSDMETTIVPQLLTELDGVEALGNVIVIGASNREDMIDPAILRPGRLDVKIEVLRPDRAASTDIFSKYLTTDLPLNAMEVEVFGDDPAIAVRAMIEAAVDRIFANDDAGRYVSGALIRNVVDRAKTHAIKAAIAGEERGISADFLELAADQELAEARSVAAKNLSGF